MAGQDSGAQLDTRWDRVEEGLGLQHKREGAGANTYIALIDTMSTMSWCTHFVSIPVKPSNFFPQKILPLSWLALWVACVAVNTLYKRLLLIFIHFT